MKAYTNIKDRNFTDIREDDIVQSDQGTKFVVSEHPNFGWMLIQSNNGTHKDLKGDWFVLKGAMGKHLTVIGNIEDNPDLMYKDDE